jgi:hypothetical protein
MVCNSCKREFDNVNELKFCPYCGAKTEESIDLEYKQITDETYNGEKEHTHEVHKNEEKKFDTLKMPAITEEDIKKHNRGKLFRDFKRIFIQKKVVIPIVTVFVFMAVGVVGYLFLIAKPVDEGRIKGDLIGKVVTLPKGTNIEIKKGYIKSLSINSRKTDKSKDEIKAAVTLNNGTIEVKTLLSFVYINEGKNQWEFKGKVALAGDTVVKPVVAMDEKQFLDGLKKLSINIGDIPEALNGEEIKSLGIFKRTPDLDKGKEEVLVDVGIDSGLLSAKGKIKCELNFENEVWSIATIDKNSNEDFALVLSPSFSDAKVIEVIKKEGLEETVTHPDLFGGKGFNVKDSFTKSINISDKKFDEQNRTLNVTIKRENIAGEIKSTLATDYIFSLSLSKMDLVKKSKTTALTATVANMSNELIISTIANVEIEGSNFLFWFPDNHKITTEEAKTFKTKEILSKKGLQNVKYVYGNINYMEGKKEKATSVVALYFLVYDGSKGYNWKIDKIIGEDSPNYKTYSKAAINQ